MNKKLFLLAIVLTLAIVCLCGCDDTLTGTYTTKGDVVLDGVTYTTNSIEFKDGKYTATYTNDTLSLVKKGDYVEADGTVTLTGDIAATYKLETAQESGVNKVYLTSGDTKLGRADNATFGGGMKIMGFGMLAIFVVMIVLFAVIKVLNKVTAPKKKAA